MNLVVFSAPVATEASGQTRTCVSRFAQSMLKRRSVGWFQSRVLTTVNED